MASTKTYLQYVNDALDELNEVQASDVTAETAFQNFVTGAVLKAVRDINDASLEWPFNVASGTQELLPGQADYSLPTDFKSVDWESFLLKPTEKVTNNEFTSNITGWTDISSGTGSAAHTSDGNGRLRIDGGASGVGAATQALTLIANQQYEVIFRHLSGPVTCSIGTSSGGTDISTGSYTITNEGQGAYQRFTFTATQSSNFITFSNSANAEYDVDIVNVRQNIGTVELRYVPLDIYTKKFAVIDFDTNPSSWGIPCNVIRRQDDKFTVYPRMADGKEYTVYFKYWSVPTEMSVNASTCTIPDRWANAVQERVLEYAYRFREDIESSRSARDNYRDIIKQMRTELIESRRNFYLDN